MPYALDFMSWIFKFGVLPYLVIVLMPGRRSFLTCLAVIGAGIAAVWIHHAMVAQSPDYKERIDATIGLALFAFATGSFLAGALVRTVTLALAASGWPFGRMLAINSAGLALLIAPFSAFLFW